jgi:hypothetical protein
VAPSQPPPPRDERRWRSGTAVTRHRQPPQSCSGRLGTVADLGERWSALLESGLEPAVAHYRHHRPHTRRACGSTGADPARRGQDEAVGGLLQAHRGREGAAAAGLRRPGGATRRSYPALCRYSRPGGAGARPKPSRECSWGPGGRARSARPPTSAPGPKTSYARRAVPRPGSTSSDRRADGPQNLARYRLVLFQFVTPVAFPHTSAITAWMPVSPIVLCCSDDLRKFVVTAASACSYLLAAPRVLIGPLIVMLLFRLFFAAAITFSGRPTATCV